MICDNVHCILNCESIPRGCTRYKLDPHIEKCKTRLKFKKDSANSVPSGGSVASGAVTEAIRLDEVEVGTACPYLKPVKTFEGAGWYLLRYFDGEVCSYDLKYCRDSSGFGFHTARGKWKIEDKR